MSHISEIVAFAQSDPNKKYREIVISTTPNFQAQRIAQDTGIQVRGARKILTTDGVRHAYSTHGNTLLENQRNQIGITDTDFEFLPEIVNNPDKVEIGNNKKGDKSIIFIKWINKKVYYIAMVYSGKDLFFATMYIKPNK